jgi:hypothetical protein
MKSDNKLAKLRFQPEQALENLRAFTRKLLTVSKRASLSHKQKQQKVAADR